MNDDKPTLLLNASVLTDFGSYDFKEITVEQAKLLVNRPAGFASAIGHRSTAQILSNLLEVKVPEHRVRLHQQPGQDAVVFKLNERIEEAVVLDLDELHRIGYTLGHLRRLD